MINEFVCTNISTQDPAALVAFYHEKLGIPIVFEGYDNYDGAKLGFSEKAPGIIVWNNSKWGERELNLLDPDGNKIMILEPAQ
ncbi:hypothetical protein K1Y86_002101 [Listeria monocytogenes]|nr:hypothetical protein [Listeria monocytogenes]EHY0410746.1 hypothetical protein [Listeria monocytogenes]